MSISTNHTVKGTEGAIYTLNGNNSNAPGFETGKTDRLRYRDALHKLSTMIGKLGNVDNKFKSILDTIGVMICMNCD